MTTNLSRVAYPALTGATAAFAIPFSYLDRSHVHLYFVPLGEAYDPATQEVTTGFTYTSDSLVTFAVAPTGGGLVIRRITPLDAALVRFASSGTLTGTNLNLAITQLLYLQQEEQESLQDQGEGVVSVPFGESGFTLPTIAARSSGPAYWDSVGELERLAPLTELGVLLVPPSGVPYLLSYAAFLAASGAGVGGGTYPDTVGRPVIPQRYIRPVLPGLRILKDLYGLLAGSNQFGIFHLGDSLEDTSWETCGTQFQRTIADWMPNAPVWACSGSNILGYTTPVGVSLAASTLYPTDPSNYTGIYHVKERYDITFDGTCMELTATRPMVVYGYGGQTLQGDYLLIPIPTGPWGGISRVRHSVATSPVPGSTWLDPTAPQIVSAHTLTGGQLLVDTYSATPGLTMVRLDFSGVITSRSVRVDYSSGGSTFVLKPQTAVKSTSSIPTYRLSTPSNDFINANPACAPIMAKLIAELNYPIIWVGSDDTINGEDPLSTPYAAYANFLPILEAAINASGLAFPPAVILEGNPHLSNGPLRTDLQLGARIDYCWDWCRSRVGWDVLDLQATTGGIAEVLRAGLNGDSDPTIHYNGILARIGSDRFSKQRGYDAPQGRRPGGDALSSQVLLGTGNNVLTQEALATAMIAPTAFDTGYMTWAAAGVGSGTTAPNLSAKTGIHLATGTTAGSSTRAYIDVAGTPMGKDQTTLRGDIRGLGFDWRSVTVDANAALYALFRSGLSGYNATAPGALTTSGFGFRAINGLTVGCCWGGLVGTSSPSGLVLSTDAGVAINGGSVAMVTGGAADYVDCVMRLYPGEVNASRGRIRWFVNGVLIGEAAYDHGSTYIFGYELLSLNGSTTAYTADMSYPKILRGGGTAS